MTDDIGAYTDDEIADPAKDDPELHDDAVLDAPDNLDDSDQEVDEAPEAGNTDDAQKDEPEGVDA
jgi:hypothetical protein